MRYVRMAALLAGLVLGGAAHESAAQTGVDPEAMVEARKLIEITKLGDLISQMLPELNKSIVNVIAKANPGIESEVRRAVDELIMPAFKAGIPSFIDEIAALYGLHFTAEELRTLIAFHGTPVGRKAIEKTPLLAQQSMAMGQAWGRHVAEEALRKAAPELRQRGLNL